ncbi:MAG: hypothetical protein FWE09_09670 [Treponema sp.]|nr:hypothetical protein [Treponema sp.]
MTRIRAIAPALALAGLALFPLAAQEAQGGLRSLDEIFPALSEAARAEALGADGYSRTFQGAAAGSGEGLASRQSLLSRGISAAALSVRPVVLVESVLVVPSEPGGRSLLDVYNALAQIRGLQGRLFDSHRRGEVPLFEEATRLDPGRRNAAIADPPRASSVPASEVVYMRLRDVNFGNTFYRAQMTLEGRGILYSLTNNRNITYLLIPVIREGRFVAQMYFEPIAEGILIYSLAGVDVSNFVARQIDMPSAISKRLAVITGWAASGISRQGS